VELGFLSSGANLKAGQNVVTSGLGGIFPQGIPIGKVVDAQSIDLGLATDARVKLNANLDSLEQVWVLFP
jgi:rod shape-determining protein MreC